MTTVRFLRELHEDNSRQRTNISSFPLQCSYTNGANAYLQLSRANVEDRPAKLKPTLKRKLPRYCNFRAASLQNMFFICAIRHHPQPLSPSTVASTDVLLDLTQSQPLFLVCLAHLKFKQQPARRTFSITSLSVSTSTTPSTPTTPPHNSPPLTH